MAQRMKNVSVRIYIIDDSAVRVWITSYGRFRGEKTADESTYPSYESSCGSLQKYALKGFVLKIKEVVDCRSVSLLVPYCCDLPKTKDTSAVRPRAVVKIHCDRWFLPREDISKGEMPGERSVPETKMIQRRLL